MIIFRQYYEIGSKGHTSGEIVEVYDINALNRIGHVFHNKVIGNVLNMENGEIIAERSCVYMLPGWTKDPLQVAIRLEQFKKSRQQ